MSYGNTPLIKISDGIYGKLEAYNPTGSVKDRLIKFLIEKEVSNKKINSDTVFCEATSGNTGIALASAAASLGVICRIYMPANMSKERVDMMSAFGAKIIKVPDNDFEEAIRQRDIFLNKNKNSWSPMQFSNPNNVDCHFSTTAPEIHKQVAKKWSAFIHGSGTGGTIAGVKKYIDSLSLPTKVCLVVPAEEKHGIQGIGDGQDFLATPSEYDDIYIIRTEDAITRSKQFAKSSGYLVGISSGANILAAELWKKKNKPDGDIITILADRGERYMSIYS
jgi:cysteine synthase A